MNDDHQRREQADLPKQGHHEIDLAGTQGGGRCVVDHQPIRGEAHHREPGVEAEQVLADDQPEVPGHGEQKEGREAPAVRAAAHREGAVDACNQPQQGGKQQVDLGGRIQAEQHRLGVDVFESLRIGQVETTLFDEVAERQVAKSCVLVDMYLALVVAGAVDQVAEV